jgi:CBS domain-containing protein
MEARSDLPELNQQAKQGGIETVAAILQRKGHRAWSIAPDATVYSAIALMAEKGVGSLVVMSQTDLVGIISERDYARKVILQGRSSGQTPVSAIMTFPVITITPENTVDQCLRIMSEHRIRYLPVIEDFTVSGIVSMGDLVNSILSMQAHTIDQLQTYITNSYPK